MNYIIHLTTARLHTRNADPEPFSITQQLLRGTGDLLATKFTYDSALHCHTFFMPLFCNQALDVRHSLVIPSTSTLKLICKLAAATPWARSYTESSYIPLVERNSMLPMLQSTRCHWCQTCNASGNFKTINQCLYYNHSSNHACVLHDAYDSTQMWLLSAKTWSSRTYLQWHKHSA